ncbi:MAG: hypothetical protein AAGF68_02005 [Pseudomonadota bacterium]
MAIFQAGVQYNDIEGTVAADRSDNLAIADHLTEKGLANPDERVVGYRISFSENQGKEIDAGVVFYLQEGSFDDPAATIRAIDVAMPHATLFKFFKRFDLVMTVKGAQFEGTEVIGPIYD